MIGLTGLIEKKNKQKRFTNKNLIIINENRLKAIFFCPANILVGIEIPRKILRNKMNRQLYKSK